MNLLLKCLFLSAHEWVNLGPAFKTWQYKLTLTAVVLGNTSVGEGRTCVPVGFSMIKWICNEVFPWHLQWKTERGWVLQGCFCEMANYVFTLVPRICWTVMWNKIINSQIAFLTDIYTHTDMNAQQNKTHIFLLPKTSQEMGSNCCFFHNVKGL